MAVLPGCRAAAGPARMGPLKLVGAGTVRRPAGGRGRFPRQRVAGVDTGWGEVPKMLVRAPVVVAGEPLGECRPQGGLGFGHFGVGLFSI